MKCCEKKKDMKFWMTRIVFIPLAICAALIAFSYIVMFLWNSLLPDILGVQTITFYQAAGILILSKILFGGIHSRSGHHKCCKKHKHHFHGGCDNSNNDEKEETANTEKNQHCCC
jgi:hypothetical protein